MIILRERLENIFFSEMYYQRGLRYCMLNKIKKAYFWLKKLKMLNQIDCSFIENLLKTFLQKNDIDTIFTELEKSEDGRLKPIYDKFKGKYTYASIQLVRLKKVPILF